MWRPSALPRAPTVAFPRVALRRLLYGLLRALRHGLLRRPSEGLVVFGVALIAYLAVAWVLVFGLNSIIGDAWSRVGNAYYVLFSRDPHLAAIGFVWNPLPSLAMMPLLPFKAVWPSLVTDGLAANIVSAAFMAGAVTQVLGIFRDLGLGRLARLALTAAFALNPMIVLYAANGMSEAPFLFFLVLAVRNLMSWLRDDRVGSLAGAGVALAFAYLTRYEAAAAAALCIAAVAIVSYRSAPPTKQRAAALADAMIVGAPFALAFVSWAVVSWVIVGSPFETFTSIYGNSAQVSRAGTSISEATGQGMGALMYAGEQILALFPALAAVGLFVAISAARRADRRFIGPVAVFGGILAFALAAFLAGSSFGWLRFYIAVVPLGAVLAGLLAATLAAAPGRIFRVAVTLAVCAAVLVSVPTATQAMLDPSLGRGETSEQLNAFLATTSAGVTPVTNYSAQAHAAGGRVASYLDRLELEDGTVLADAATAFPVLLQSARPRQFVITSDRDFMPILADPARFDVRYVVVSQNAGGDAVNRAYPGIYRSGAGIAELAAEFTEGSFSWRVYQLTDS